MRTLDVGNKLAHDAAKHEVPQDLAHQGEWHAEDAK